MNSETEQPIAHIVEADYTFLHSAQTGRIKMKKLLIGLALCAAVVVLVPAAFMARNIWMSIQHEARSPEGRLVCSETAYLRYMAVVGEVGEMGIGLVPSVQNRDSFERLMTAYEALDISGPQTSIFVAHVPTGQIYSQSCRDERCTMEEMAAPDQACLTEHMNQCSYIAIRFKGEEFCLLGAPQDKDPR